MKRKIFIILVLSICNLNIASASCIEETESLDTCLQCCGDTESYVQLTHSDSKIKEEIKASCSNPKQNLKVSKKYKVDSSLLFFICNSKNITTSLPIENTYEECVKLCEKRYKEETSAQD